MNTATISQLEATLLNSLAPHIRKTLTDNGFALPDSAEPYLRLLDEGGRKKRSTAAASHWNPATDLIELGFEEVSDEADSVPQQAIAAPGAEAAPLSGSITSENQSYPQSAVTVPSVQDDERLDDLVRVLDRIESSPGMSFVALKRLRDDVLPYQGFPWAAETAARKDVLGCAVDLKLVLIGKQPNPKLPEFPVTSVRLNRYHPRVRKALALDPVDEMKWEPITIPGEPLSHTVIRDRGPR